MMHHALIAWPNFDGFKPAGFIYRSAKDKIPVLVTAAGRELVRLFRIDNQIGRAHVPAVGKFH
jgi:hypothetical protein